MTTVDLTKHPDPDRPARPATALAKLTAGREPKPALDTAAPIRPEWLRTVDGFRAATALTLRRGAYRTGRFLLHLPALLGLLALYSPRGLGRLVARLGRYLYDYDSAQVRHAHASNTETKEYVQAQNVRRANLKARWLVAGTAALLVAGPILAWTFPRGLAVLIAGAVFVWTTKLIPGRSVWELVGAAALAVAVWWYLPALLARFPGPPPWTVAPVAAAAVLALGVFGRPAGRQLLADAGHGQPAALVKPTAPMVLDALVAAVPGITDRNRDTIRVHAPGVARGRHGYYLGLELPPGCTVSDVMENRESFAAALRRQLGAVWPGQGPMHPGHLRVFIGDEPMATAEQAPWPLAQDRRLDIFDPLPLFTDQEGRWFEQRLMYNALVIGGAPGFGKTFCLRALGVAIARDPRTRIVVLDGKANGDMRPFRLVAHGYHEGDEPQEIAEQLAAVRAIREEMRRRARFLRELPPEVNPEDKVTTQLVDRYRDLAPTFLLIDECQVYTEHPDKKIREAFIEALADIVRRGRSAGIVPVFCTQKPSADVLPTAIVDNCSVRLCFKVNGQRANDAVLGNEMHSSGIKATKFGPDDRGLAWLKGDGAVPLVVRTPHGVDKPTAETLLKQCRAARDRLGLLSGYAAGEDAADEAVQVSLLEDVRDVLDSPENNRKNMSLAGIRDRLELLRPGVWGHLDVDALGAALRNAGVRPSSVWCPDLGRTGQGVKREWLDIAATSDVNPDDPPNLSATP